VRPCFRKQKTKPNKKTCKDGLAPHGGIAGLGGEYVFHFVRDRHSLPKKLCPRATPQLKKRVTCFVGDPHQLGLSISIGRLYVLTYREYGHLPTYLYGFYNQYTALVSY
jgi:hypothetical protein